MLRWTKQLSVPLVVAGSLVLMNQFPEADFVERISIAFGVIMIALGIRFASDTEK
jgi:hypothetical protein